MKKYLALISIVIFLLFIGSSVHATGTTTRRLTVRGTRTIIGGTPAPFVASSSNAVSGNNVSSLTFNVPISSNLSNVTVVLSTCYNKSGGDTVLTYTLNSVGGKQIRHETVVSNTSCDLWYVTSPSAGSLSAVVTLASATGIGRNMTAGAHVIANSATRNPIDVSGGFCSAASAHTTNSDSVTTTGINDILVDIEGVDSQPTQNAGQTQDWAQTTGTVVSGGSHTTLKNVPGSVSMGWSFTSTSASTCHSMVGIF